MCGIVCGNIVDNEFINRALTSLSPRGPDGNGVVKIDNVFLGHTLLSIFTEDPVTQPIWSNDKTVVGCVNGEIYNYRILRRILENNGYVFETDSDSEVLVHGIHWKGKEFVKYLDGEFCFVTYNTKSKSWICAVDSFSTKPLKYYLDKNSFFIASNATTISALGIDLDIDIESCLFSFASQCLPNGKTLYKNIFTIPPSYILSIDDDLNSSLEKYACSDNFDSDLDNIEFLLESAILGRSPKYKKLAVALSSGIDSSSIAYYLKKNDFDFQCFSIDFPESIYSESNDIKKFCKRHNISTTFVNISGNDLILNFPTVILNSENLSMNPHAVGKYLMNKEMINQGYKVCLTGDGADELFYGYSHFHTDNKFQFILDSSNTGSKYLEIFSESFKKVFNLSCILAESKGSVQDLYYKYWLSEYGLKILGDSQSASVGQEHRYPFLDRDMHSHINSIKDFRSLNYPSKQVLRNIVEKWDKELANIPKRPFISPIIDKNWLHLFEKYVFENNKFFELGFFERDKLIPYIQQLKSETFPSSIILSQILSLGILCNG
jgi:asparagine synthase (glutamine-hydrolysing)